MFESFPTDPYEALRTAIKNTIPVAVVHRGKRRLVCPYILGRGDGERRIVVWQFGGASSSGLPSKGDWRNLTVDHITKVSPLKEPWIEQRQPSQPQTYITSIDIARPGFEKIDLKASIRPPKLPSLPKMPGFGNRRRRP